LPELKLETGSSNHIPKQAKLGLSRNEEGRSNILEQGMGSGSRLSSQYNSKIKEADAQASSTRLAEDRSGDEEASFKDRFTHLPDADVEAKVKVSRAQVEKYLKR